MVDQTLAGKVAIVTGSAGGGIGEAIAKDLSSKGARVVINYPWAAEKDQAEQVLASLPASGIIVEANLATLDGPKTLIDKTVEHYGHIDILVNNASVAVHKSLQDTTLEDWDFLVNLNGRGYLLTTQAVLPHLSQKDSRIVNVLSLASIVAPVNHTLYAGTKGMQEAFTRVWAKELPPMYGCTVNSVSPGPTQTKCWEEMGDEVKTQFEPIIQQTPVAARFGTPEEVAWGVGMLCEPKARWINGTNLMACGGLYVP